MKRREFLKITGLGMGTMMIPLPFKALPVGSGPLQAAMSSADENLPEDPAVTRIKVTSKGNLQPHPDDPVLNFGRRIVLSADGNTVVVAAQRSGSETDGYVYIYKRQESAFQLSYLLFINNTRGKPNIFKPGSNDRWALDRSVAVKGDLSATAKDFGEALAISRDGNTLVVGAPGTNDADGDSYGVIYTFMIDPQGKWTVYGPTFSTDSSVGQEFGASVAIVDTMLVVGAPGEDNTAGAVYVLTNNQAGDGNFPMTKIGLPAGPGDRFGQSVAIVGSYIAATSPGKQVAGRGGGVLKILKASGDSQWGSPDAFDITVNDTSEKSFGRSIVSLNDVIHVSAGQATYIVTTKTATEAEKWKQENVQISKLVLPSGDAALPGTGIALAGRMAVVGSDEKGAYVSFQRPDGAKDWPIAAEVTAKGGQAVAASGSQVCVGLPSQNKVNLFEVKDTYVPPPPPFTIDPKSTTLPFCVTPNPLGTVISPDGKRIYAGCGRQVHVIDTGTKQQIGGPIGVGNSANGMAITPDGKKLLVLNDNDGTYSIIHTDTLKVTGPPVPVKKITKAAGITPDGRWAYVGIDNHNDLYRLDIENNTVSPTNPLQLTGMARHVAVSPDGKYAYAATMYNNTVTVIDIQTNQIKTTIPLSEPPGFFAVDPGGKWLYVGLNNTFLTIDMKSNTLQGAPIALPEGSPYISSMAISPDGNWIYFNLLLTKEIVIYDTRAGRFHEKRMSFPNYTIIPLIAPTGTEGYVFQQTGGWQSILYTFSAPKPSGNPTPIGVPPWRKYE